MMICITLVKGWLFVVPKTTSVTKKCTDDLKTQSVAFKKLFG